MNIRRRCVKKARIEILPMIDVVFFLLVFFMISSLAVSSHGQADVSLPKTNSLSQENSAALTVTLLKDGSLYVDDRMVSLSELARQCRYQKPSTLRIKADQQTPYRDILAVIDICKQAGVAHIALISEQ